MTYAMTYNNADDLASDLLGDEWIGVVDDTPGDGILTVTFTRKADIDIDPPARKAAASWGRRLRRRH